MLNVEPGQAVVLIAIVVAGAAVVRTLLRRSVRRELGRRDVEQRPSA